MKATVNEIFNHILDKHKKFEKQPILSLRDWINKYEISITDLSKVLKVDKGHISKCMRGKKRPSPQLMDHIKVITNGKIKDIDDLIDPF